MDERLIELAKELKLSEGGFTTEPSENVGWATGWKVKAMIELIPSLYQYKGKRKSKNSRSSYGLKHELEHLFQTYAPELSSLHTNWVGNGELILAFQYCDYEFYAKDGPNAYYNIKEYRKGASNKGGVGKMLAIESERQIKDFLRKEVEKFHPSKV